MAPLFQRLFAGEEVEERPKAAKEVPQEAAAEVTSKAESSEGTTLATSVLTQTAVRETPSGLIPASKLPPAADALAELFAEAPGAAEKPRAEETPLLPEKDSESNGEPPAAAVGSKKGSIFSRILKFKRAPATMPEKPPIVETVSETGTHSQIVASAETEVGTEAPTEVATHAVGAPKPQDAPEAAPASFAYVSAVPEAPILAELLPSAADDFEKLFPSEKTLMNATAHVSAEGSEELEGETLDEEILEASTEIEVDELMEVVSNISPEPSFAESLPDLPATCESPRFGGATALSPDTQSEARAERTPVEIIQPSAEPQKSTARLGSRETEWPYENPYHAPAEATSPVHSSEKRAEIPEAAPQDRSRTALAEDAEEIAAATASATETTRRPYKAWAFDEKLASHREWVESHGMTGQRADLSTAELEASDLISVNLRLADLHDANLRASDLLLADLRDACLVRADLEEACLVGANLEGANLEGASLETAMGLVPTAIRGSQSARRVAGAATDGIRGGYRVRARVTKRVSLFLRNDGRVRGFLARDLEDARRAVTYGFRHFSISAFACGCRGAADCGIVFDRAGCAVHSLCAVSFPLAATVGRRDGTARRFPGRAHARAIAGRESSPDCCARISAG